jgi:hypothetical protein
MVLQTVFILDSNHGVRGENRGLGRGRCWECRVHSNGEGFERGWCCGRRSRTPPLPLHSLSHSLSSARGCLGVRSRHKFPVLPSSFYLHHPPLLPLLPMMQSCSGSSRDSSPCMCTSFTSRPPPKENKCNTCGHRRSTHTDNTPNVNGKYIKRLLQNMTATAVHEEARKETIQGFRPEQPSSTPASTVCILPYLFASTVYFIHSFVVCKGKGEGCYPSNINPCYSSPALP